MTPSSRGSAEAAPSGERWIGAAAEPFGGGELWIGRHAVDQDVLVLDPAETDASAEVLALYSLTQHRLRRFARARVQEQIHPLEDAAARQRAERAYAQREVLRGAHQEAVDSAQSERMEGVREGMVQAHRRHVEQLGLAYEGVLKSAPPKGTRAAKCHVCEIPLDGFVGMSCARCQGVLCSCGACACGKPARGRKAAAAAAAAAAEAEAEGEA